MRDSRISFNVKGYVDRRTPELLGAERAMEQAKADEALERLWRDRVRTNEIRRGLPPVLAVMMVE